MSIVYEKRRPKPSTLEGSRPVDTGRLFLFADGLQDPKPKVIKLIKNPSGTPLQGSFLFEDPSGESLWIGDYKATRAYRFSYAYLRNAPGVISIDQAESVRDLPPKPNGAIFLQGDLWVASSTAGCGKLTNGQGTVGFGPGAEELEFDSTGRLWAIFEAGSLKYSAAGVGIRPFFPLITQFDPSKLVESVGEHCVKYVGA